MPLASVLAVALAGSHAAFFHSQEAVDFPAVGEEKLVEISGFAPSVPFNEAIVSWNVSPAKGAHVTVEARATGEGYLTKWYTLADWELDDASKRISIEKQKDEHGDVLTDTLQLAKEATQVDVRLRLRRTGDGPTPVLKLVTISTAHTGRTAPSTAAPNPAWGKTVDVPQRAQGNYPRGGVLCSPTSISMMLWHYSNLLGRPELNKDVPEVEANVWDRVYDGAGNWPFNAAYAGSFPGITSYVTRFGGIQDLEKWIAAGLPVVCSVSLDILMGKEKPRPSGHLVVLVGFEKNGDPVFNDPAHRDQVRRTYKRANFEKAWLRSHRAVYILHPDDAKVPTSDSALWLARD
ncbi:MAG: peptidase C39 family protein [Fimbriimonas sp.]